MPGRRLDKKNKIIAFLREGETSCVFIANRVKCDIAYVNVVKNQLLQELLRAKE